MPNYRRKYLLGGTFFFTVVTAQRHPIFNDEAAVVMLRECVRNERKARPFAIDAAVVLHDHLHMIWTLPPGDTDYSTRWSAIKAAFTRVWLACGGSETAVSIAKAARGYRGVWQPRFIEHTCRDQDDLAEHIEYVHFNPVKHDYVKRPADWPHSSIHRYIEASIVTPDWGSAYDEKVDSGLLE